MPKSAVDTFVRRSQPSSPSGDLTANAWEKLRKGDQVTFTQIYYQYIDALYHYGERLTPERTLVEDCLQDLFAKLWSRRKQLPPVSAVKFYLFKALKRLVTKRVAQQRRFTSDSRLSEYSFEITLNATVDLSDYHIPPAKSQQLLRAVNQLSARQKEAITLYFYDGFSYEEIAEIMTMNTRSVYNLVYRALAVLRGALDIKVWRKAQ